MADYAVNYNGTLLQQAVPGAQVTDIVVQPIPILFTKLDRVADDGNLPVRRRLNERTVQIDVELPLNPKIAQFTENVRKLRAWAESDVELPLILPDYPGKYLNSVLTAIDNISINEWFKPVKMTFTAFNEPFFQSEEESTGTVGAAFIVSGDIPARPKITHTITSPLTNPQWTLAPGYVISLSGTYTSGTIVIDTQHGYVSKDGESLMPYLNPASRFYKFKKGGYVIGGPSGGTISWRERWRD